MSIFPSNSSIFDNDEDTMNFNNSSICAYSSGNAMDSISLSDFSMSATLYQRIRIKIPKGVSDFDLFKCFDISPTFLLIKTDYCKCINSLDELEWRFDDDCIYDMDGELCVTYNHLGELLILTSPEGLRKILINNPDEENCVYIDVLVSGNSTCVEEDDDGNNDNDMTYDELPFFATSEDIGTLTEQDGDNNPPNTAHFTFFLVSDSSDNQQKQTFDVPADFDPLIRIEQYMILYNSWIVIDSMNFDKTMVIRNINGAMINYYRYTYNGSKIGSRKLRVFI